MGNQTGPTFDTFTQRLSDDVRSAIDLRHMFYQREMDHLFELNNGTILYAVDSNILNAHFQIGDSRPRKYREISRVFRGSRKNTSSHTDGLLSEVIVSYLVRSLGTPRLQIHPPLLLLPGHDDEVRRLYDNIIKGWDSKDRTAQETRATLIGFLERFRRLDTPESRLELTSQFESQLFDLLYRIQEPAERIQEFNRLLAEQRLLTFHRAAVRPILNEFKHPDSGKSVFLDFSAPRNSDIREGSDLWWHETPLSVSGGPEQRDAPGSQEWWDKELYEDVPAKFRSVDSYALSILYNANRALRSSNSRIVLLTLGEDIVDLGRKFFPYSNSDSELSNFSFSDLYIRHPRAFLSEPQIMTLSQDQSQQADLTVWLDAFLAEVSGSQHQSMSEFQNNIRPILSDQEQLLGIARAALRRRPDIHRGLFKKWQNFVDDILTAHAAPSLEARKALSRVLGRMHVDKLDSLEQFEEYMREITERSWDDFFFTAAKTGVDFIGQFNTRARRNVPFLYLGDIGEAGGLSDLIRRINGVVKSIDEVRQHLDDLNAIDRGTFDPSGSINSICYAALFAHAGRWSIAKQIAMRAESIARRVRRSAGQPDAVGAAANAAEREANYMCSVSHRLTATSEEDLEACDRYLDAASEALRQSVNSARLTSPPHPVPVYPPVTGTRFDAERIAISVARLLFRCRKTNWNFTVVAKSDQTADIVQRSTEIMSEVRTALSNAENCQDDTISRASKISLRRSFFNSVFLLEATEALSDEARQEVADLVVPHLADLKAVYGSGCAEHLSIMDMSFMLYAASFAQYVKDPTLVEIQRVQTELERSVSQGSENFLMPYDAGRFRQMAEYARQHCRDRRP